jgi:hypothetical protein
MAHTRDEIILTSSSSGTGLATWVGDARLITLSIRSSTASASRYTISGSNDNGFQAAIAEGSWSNMTTIVSQGIYTIDPGVRWIRAEQPVFSLSATSANTMIINRHMQ